MLAEFSNLPIEEAFYKAGDLSGRTIADPFMGGGTPLIEANRMGAHVLGCDINPMAYWIVRQEMEYLDLAEYRSAASTLRKELEKKIGYLYRTRCEFCGNPHANVKYFLWVKTTQCDNCGKLIDLFPGYLIAEDVRHPKNVFICAKYNVYCTHDTAESYQKQLLSAVKLFMVLREAEQEIISIFQAVLSFLVLDALFLLHRFG